MFSCAHTIIALYLRNQLERRSQLSGICSEIFRGGVSYEKPVIRGLRFGKRYLRKSNWALMSRMSDSSCKAVSGQYHQIHRPVTWILTQAGHVGSCLVDFIVWKNSALFVLAQACISCFIHHTSTPITPKKAILL